MHLLLIFHHSVPVLFWEILSLPYWGLELRDKAMRKVIGKGQILTGNNFTQIIQVLTTIHILISLSGALENLP